MLDLSKDAGINEVKEAYRRLAIKYYPKNNTDPDAEQRFAEVAKAYETILESKKKRDFGDLGFNSFFEDFEKEVSSMHKEAEAKEEGVKEAKEEVAKEKKDSDKGFGELYSESSSYESVNGRQTKCTVEKVYKKEGKLLKVHREERLKDDGKMEITETIDNG